MGQCNWFVFVDLKLSVIRKEELVLFGVSIMRALVVDILSLGRILGRIRIGGQPYEVFLFFFFLDDEFSDGQLPTALESS